MQMLEIEGMCVEPPFEKDMASLLQTMNPAATSVHAANLVLANKDRELTCLHAMPPTREDNDAGLYSPVVNQTAASFTQLSSAAMCPREVMAEALELGSKYFSGRIALIGLMGCGKSRNGRRLARKMDWRFKDMDDAIEATAERSIPEIFARDGEEGFRKLETQVLEKLSNTVETVVSCGGGVVTRPENQKLLQKHFLCVWLVASMDTIIARTTGSDRPLLAVEDPRAKAEALFSARRMMYANSADIIVSTESTCQQEADEKIFQEINAAFPD